MLDTIKQYLFKIRASHIILTLIIFVALITFLIVSWASNLTATNNPIFTIIILSIFFLLSRLSVLVKVGIGFLPFIMFGVMLKFGFVVNMAIIWVTTFIYLYIATRPTPIDFAITKGVQSSISQAIYLSLWTFAMIPFFYFFPLAVILTNPVMYYMLSVVIYIIFMTICLPIFAQEPMPMVLINGFIMIPIQWAIMTFLGQGFFAYLGLT